MYQNVKRFHVITLTLQAKKRKFGGYMDCNIKIRDKI